MNSDFKRILLRRGHASALPFCDRNAASVVVPTGVLDPVSSIHSLEIVSECKRVLRKAGTLVVEFAAPTESAVQSAEQVGYVEDRYQHWDRMVDIWEAGLDDERQSLIVAGWTGRSMNESRHLHRSFKRLTPFRRT